MFDELGFISCDEVDMNACLDIFANLGGSRGRFFVFKLGVRLRDGGHRWMFECMVLRGVFLGSVILG